MTNLCARCGKQVSYFGRRFADHRWFCSEECVTSWERDHGLQEEAAQAGTGRKLSRVAKLLIALAGIAGLILAMVSCGLLFRWTAVVPEVADSPAQADILNRELMASLLSDPSSVLVEEEVWDELCCHPAQRFRLLTYVYATSGTIDDVVALYRKRLVEAGWLELQDVTGGPGFQKEGIVTFITPLQPLPSGDFAGLSELAQLQLVSRTPLQEPPAGLSTFYGVTTSRRLDCLRAECFRWPTGPE